MPEVKKVGAGFQYTTKGNKPVGGVKRTRKEAAAGRLKAVKKARKKSK